ncbi:o-succinylbenzoate--CoA ligase [Kineococcus rubinsiae]|uniref:o-succinylbenzoate--CoA ligase n=1 Tax=Kineococcus rubinsiae TaxID=2609562 RepID=UPI00142F44B4|nr:AMP-binding protein [Kineococcus rubinsiae]
MLRPLPVPAGEAVLGVLPQLARALAGRGDALLPHAAGSAPPAALAPGTPLADGEDAEDDPTAVVVATSGSTGTAKGALLPAGALRASAAATAHRLLPGGPAPGASGEQWVLALPAQHVAGLQVLLRSVRAGTEPVVVDLSGGFTPAAFVAAAAACTGGHRLVSLVPTQLVRLLDAGEEATAALAGFAAVLVGAAATPPALLERARAAGVAVRTTYGSSETCGGCVYDGLPLDGVRVGLEGDRLTIAGDVVARGYRGRPGDPAFDLPAGGPRRFRTDDAAVLADGLVRVTGRLDDLVTTGGLKVAPALVEAALAGDPGVAEVVVVGVPDAQWGERVVACVVPAPGGPVPDLLRLRALVTARVAAAAAPRQLVLLDALPLRGPGKPDRRRLRELAQGNDAAQGNDGDRPVV